MRLHEQRNALAYAIADCVIELTAMKSAVRSKIRAPYPDGSRRVDVNAETDVIPRLDAIVTRLIEAAAAGGLDARPVCHTAIQATDEQGA
jgi:hypothetical protein